MANVGQGEEGSHRRCGRCCSQDCAVAVGEAVSCLCGCEVTARDLLRLLPCITWVLLSVLSSVLHIAVPVCQHRFPETMPIFWGWLSALPAFMCAVLIVMYHRDILMEKGISKDAAISMGLVYGFLTTLGLLVYATFLISALVLIFRCHDDLGIGLSAHEHCQPGNFGYNAFWFFMCVTWLVFQSCLTPRQRFVQELILKHEHAQAGFSLDAVGAAAVNPAAASDSQQQAGVVLGRTLHPTVYGNPAVYETASVYGSSGAYGKIITADTLAP